MNLLEIIKIGKNQYGIVTLIKIFYYEIINFHKFRYYDYFNIKKFSKSLEPCIPTPYYVLNLLDNKLKDEYNNSIFIDFGCGKGRVISHIKKNNFKKIIGIEINDKLNIYLKFIEKNILIYNDDCRNMEFIRKLNNNLLNENIIMYFYHPFSINLINNIIEIFLNNKKKIHIIIVGKLKIDNKLINKLEILYNNKMLQIYSY